MITQWPNKKPNIPPFAHRFASGYNDRLFDKYVKPDMGVIVDVGTWLGWSAREFIKRTETGLVYTIDNWTGVPAAHTFSMPSSVLDNLRDVFIVNSWEYRDRIRMIESDTIEGLSLVWGLEPKVDLVYIDASHDYYDVYDDVRKALSCWPDAQVMGDDYHPIDWPGVVQAVKDYAHEYGFEIDEIGTCWALRRKQ